MTTGFNIRDFGAKGDGTTNDAPAIQAAIDACTKSGGGRVLVPGGAVYLAGSIALKSNVELHIERGATLACSGRWDDITERWKVTALSSGILTEKTRYSGSFLTARGAENIAVTGAGTIDGGGRHYVLRDLGAIYEMPVERPFTLFFYGCRNVRLAESHYTDGALWMLRLTGCENVVIHGLHVEGDMKLPNADGIDLDHCRNVRISDCLIETPDDAISLKTCEEFPDLGPTENVTVTNCVLRTNSSALVVGVDARDPIRNVVFSNCVIRDSHRGLSVNMSQDSFYENILFSNITVETRVHDKRWWGRGEPIYVSSFPWHDVTGRIRNVRFSNILARAETGIYVDAERPGLIEGLVFDAVDITLDRWSAYPNGEFDRRPYCGEPFFAHPPTGFFLRNASDVLLRDCRVRSADPANTNPAPLVTEGVDGLRVTDDGLRG